MLLRRAIAFLRELNNLNTKKYIYQLHVHCSKIMKIQQKSAKTCFSEELI
jgi:hypothetical protein